MSHDVKQESLYVLGTSHKINGPFE